MSDKIISKKEREREKRRETAVAKATVSRKGEGGWEGEGGGERRKETGCSSVCPRGFERAKRVCTCATHTERVVTHRLSPVHHPTRGWWLLRKNSDWRKGEGDAGSEAESSPQSISIYGQGPLRLRGVGVRSRARGGTYLPVAKARGEAQRMVWGERRY